MFESQLIILGGEKTSAKNELRGGNIFKGIMGLIKRSDKTKRRTNKKGQQTKINRFREILEIINRIKDGRIF